MEKIMPRELSSTMLQAAVGASSYYHDLDDNRGEQGARAGGSASAPQQAVSDLSSSHSQGSFGYDHEYQKPLVSSLDEVDNLDKAAADIFVDDNNNSVNNFLSPASIINHGDIGFHANSLINFKNGGSGSGSLVRGKGSLLSFEQNPQTRINQHKEIDDGSFIWKDGGNNIMGCYNDYSSRQVTRSDPKGSSSSRILDEISNCSYQPGSSSYGWLYSDSTVVAADRSVHPETAMQGGALHKRPYTGDQSARQPSKKQCTTVPKSSSSKPNEEAASTKDPQSIAAKNRRERISERLKVLQELVPNGPKVDLVTMLEKAISYVKFLQLQVKVLATDEFWPAQGGKAPDISQVKEAIDAILASQRDRSSSSK